MTAAIALLTLAATATPTPADAGNPAAGLAIFGGIIGLTIAVISLIITIVWIVLPFLLLSQLSKLNKQVALLVERVTPAAGAMQAAAPEISSARNAAKNCVELQVRTNELLEWLGTKDSA